MLLFLGYILCPEHNQSCEWVCHREHLPNHDSQIFLLALNISAGLVEELLDLCDGVLLKKQRYFILTRHLVSCSGASNLKLNSLPCIHMNNYALEIDFLTILIQLLKNGYIPHNWATFENS